MSLLVLSGTGCKSAEQKVLEETLALHEQAYMVLKDNQDAPEKAVAALRKLEEDSREQRGLLRQRGSEALANLSDKERVAFYEEGKKRAEEYAAKFGVMLRKFDAGPRSNIELLLQEITH